MSGFSVAAARAGAPDAGLLSSSEVLDSLASCVQATAALPIIADGDTGYGNALNVRRTVAAFAGAGAAGVLIEDQAWPKSCGHVQGKGVVGRGEAVARVRAAAAARDEVQADPASRILLIARTDARQAVSLEEALWRAVAFAEAGADAVFVDALESESELRALAGAVRGAAPTTTPPGRRVFLMANNLEGGGKTPLLAAPALAGLGYALVAYPLTLLGARAAAEERALAELRAGALVPGGLPSFAHLQDTVGFGQYFAEADAWAAVARGVEEGGVAPAPAAATQPPPPPPPPPPPRPAVEPDAVILASTSPSSSSTSSLRPTRTAYGSGGGGGGPSSPSLSTTSFLRIKIVNTADGSVRLETRIPAGFVEGLAAIVPAAAGLDVQGLARAIAGQEWGPGEPVFKQSVGAGQEIEIYLE
jgi:2-methylisocitrate lyase-like PEP mutase family enzyme